MKEPAWLRNTGKHTAIVVHIIVIQLAITVRCTVQYMLLVTTKTIACEKLIFYIDLRLYRLSLGCSGAVYRLTYSPLAGWSWRKM